MSIALLFLVAGAAPPPGPAPLPLAAALARADSQAYANRAATAAVAQARADRDAALRGLLPGVRFEGGYVRSTDPLNTFGFLLRQRSVTEADFAPDRLNFPEARGNLQTGFVAELPLVNLDAWAGRAAAGHAARARAEGAAWSATGTRLDVVRAYYGAVLASEQVRTLEAAHAAAAAHVRQAQSAADNGLVTKSDVLLARVKAGEIETRLVAARGAARLAVRRLALVLGTPADSTLRLPGALPDSAALAALLVPAPADTAGRADVRAALLGVEAAEADRARAGRTLLPRLNAFGRYDWNSPDTPFGGEGMWTAGVQLSWSPFSGGQELAQRRAASAAAAAATAAAEATRAAAALEVEQARVDLDVAVQAQRIARAAVAQGTEAHRIVSRKYEGGLADVVELLDAQAVELASRLGEAQARYDLIVARAALARATGDDLMRLAHALDAAAPTEDPTR